ncbi:MAG: hypothetical protein JW908_05180 [Anaerolineales bacterium]|nr:hypothetical protein [Anaerolineales bacterium]
MDRPDYIRREYFDEQQYESLVQAGIAAVKGGDKDQGMSLLFKASQMKPGDARPWLWLSATTEDLQEQRKYLEYAVAADPSNSAARQGLVLLSDKLDRSRLLKEGEGYAARHPQEPEVASGTQVFSCPKCGGHMIINLDGQLVCEYCGHEETLEQNHVADEAEQVLDFILPTTRGHRWSETQQQLVCAQCGAVSLLPEEVRATECPYCGSHQLITSEEISELIDPQVIAPAKISDQDAAKRIREWLGAGWFVPDDLRKLAQSFALRPAYYPFWTFDGTLHLKWTCEINEGSGDSSDWVPRDGVELEMFDDVLVPGIKSLLKENLADLEPFNLKEVVEFDPSFVAGWNALAYDHSLADASLVARQKVIRKIRSQLYSRVLPTKQKRNLKGGAIDWSGMTFKHVLIPLWLGSYTYQGKEYHIVINGCTGKIAGEKPLDMVKVGLAIFSGVVLLILFVMIIAGLIL